MVFCDQAKKPYMEEANQPEETSISFGTVDEILSTLQPQMVACDQLEKQHIVEANQPKDTSEAAAGKKGGNSSVHGVLQAGDLSSQETAEQSIEEAKEPICVPSKPDPNCWVFVSAKRSNKGTPDKLKRVADDSKTMHSQIKSRSVIREGIETSNRFNYLQENSKREKTPTSKENMSSNIFIIGNRNIFSSRRSKCIVQARPKDQEECAKEGDDRDDNKASNSKVIKFDMKNRKSKWFQQTLKQFETKNSFEVLIDNPEENLEQIISRNKILSTPKKSLKRCRKCHFKRRACILDSSKCNSLQKCCRKCKKIGHLPKSINCKGRKGLTKCKIYCFK